MKYKTLTLLLASGLLASTANAETLNNALSHALAVNPTLAAAQSNYEALSASQYITLADMLPQVVAFASETRSNTDAENYRTGLVNSAANIGDHDVDAYGVSVTQSLFTSGKNLNAFRGKRAEIRSARADLTETEQQVIGSAIAAYLEVLRTQSVYDLNEENANVLEKQLQEVRDRFEVGVVTRTDVAQSEAALAGAQAGLLRAEADLRGAKAVYREVYNQEPNDLSELQKLPRLPRSLNDAISIARRESPLLISSKEMSASGRFNTYSAIGSALPSVTVRGSYTNYEDPTKALAGVEMEVTEVVATLTVPIFTGGRSVMGISAASSYSDALKYQVHATSDAVERGVIVAWNNYKAAAAAIDAQKQLIIASEIALDGVREENKLGTRTNLDVLDAERDLLDARVALVTVDTTRNLAAYSLLASVGRLTGKHLRVKPAEGVERN